MSTDYGEKEREFIAALKADTGKSLEEWMAAIDAAGLTQRNDIIDWLRRQSFMFSKASWIERIHNNGGKPIYTGGGSSRPSAVPRAAAPRIKRPALTIVPAAPAPAPRSPPPSQAAPPPPLQEAPLPPAAPPPPAPQLPPIAPALATASPPPADPAALDALLATAKAFRPLAAYVLAEIRKAMPDVAVAPAPGLATLARNGAVFAILTVSAKELRLGIAAKDRPAAPFSPAKFAPNLVTPPAITHMVVLTDARQITPDLIAAVLAAST
jgi:hypothetical protein